jgi:hypothetical protein
MAAPGAAPVRVCRQLLAHEVLDDVAEAAGGAVRAAVGSELEQLVGLCVCVCVCVCVQPSYRVPVRSAVHIFYSVDARDDNTEKPHTPRPHTPHSTPTSACRSRPEITHATMIAPHDAPASCDRSLMMPMSCARAWGAWSMHFSWAGVILIALHARAASSR